eukprot:scaffold4731_cov144-Isochrysis_galbana.AAC.6
MSDRCCAFRAPCSRATPQGWLPMTPSRVPLRRSADWNRLKSLSRQGMRSPHAQLGCLHVLGNDCAGL